GILGGTSAGWRISGPVGVSLDNCATHVDTVDIASGAPAYGITFASDGISPPVWVNISGGFYNGTVAWDCPLQLPLASSTRTFGYSGGQWNPGHVPVLRTSV